MCREVAEGGRRERPWMCTLMPAMGVVVEGRTAGEGGWEIGFGTDIFNVVEWFGWRRMEDVEVEECASGDVGVEAGARGGGASSRGWTLYGGQSIHQTGRTT